MGAIFLGLGGWFGGGFSLRSGVGVRVGLHLFGSDRKALFGFGSDRGQRWPCLSAALLARAHNSAHVSTLQHRYMHMHMHSI